MLKTIVLFSLAVLLCMLSTGSIAQDGQEPPLEDETPPVEEPTSDAPEIPSVDEVRGQQAPQEFIPTTYQFRIGVVGQSSRDLQTTTGVQQKISSPLFVIDPRTGQYSTYAQNFPANILDSSKNGEWVVGIAPSYIVEGSSGSRDRECFVSLDLNEGTIKLIEEFPRFSKFNALFLPDEKQTIYYSINQPAQVNRLVRYNLGNAEQSVVPAEGNRFYIHGIKNSEPRGIWVEDPAAVSIVDYPVLVLLNRETGEVQQRAKFPGVSEVIVHPSGDYVLAVVTKGAEASIGYYDVAARTGHQVPNLVLTRPSFQWLQGGLEVIALESTSVRDRFLRIDLITGEVVELFSGYFKVAHWDVSPDDDAIAFVTDTEQEPLVFIVPTVLGENNVTNRIPMAGVNNVSWLGCIRSPGGGGSWLDNLLPF